MHLITRLDKKRSFLSSKPMDSECFDCFRKGFEAGIGQWTKQDMVISIEVMLKIQQLNEKQWTVVLEQGDLTPMHAAAPIWGCCTAYAFCHSL
jgi:hypothetical protein